MRQDEMQGVTTLVLMLGQRIVAQKGHDRVHAFAVFYGQKDFLHYGPYYR